MAYGLGPAFKEQLIYDVRCSKTPFSLQYAAPTLSQVKKQMELHIHYWLPVHDEDSGLDIIHHNFWPCLWANCCKCFMSIFTDDDIPLKQLLTLGSDGPNVNKTIWSLLEQKVKAKCPEFNGFVDIGTCNIHVIHNRFGKSIEKYGKDCGQLAIDVHSLYKYRAARRKDFRELQLDFRS